MNMEQDKYTDDPTPITADMARVMRDTGETCNFPDAARFRKAREARDYGYLRLYHLKHTPWCDE
jgi:hypothetical protein